MKTYNIRTAAVLAATWMLAITTFMACSKHDEVPPKSARIDTDFVLPPAPALTDAERQLIEQQRTALQEAINQRNSDENE